MQGEGLGGGQRGEQRTQLQLFSMIRGGDRLARLGAAAQDRQEARVQVGTGER